jgi:hypothetical protein
MIRRLIRVVSVSTSVVDLDGPRTLQVVAPRWVPLAWVDRAARRGLPDHLRLIGAWSDPGRLKSRRWTLVYGRRAG